MPFDPSEIIKALKELFGDNLPPWVLTALGWGFLIGLAFAGLVGLLAAIKTVRDRWVNDIRTMFYNAEERQRRDRRRRFADHVESQIKRLNSMESWSDFRFAELEADVEAEGKQRVSSLLSFFGRSRSSLRREKSLSKALENSLARLILLEGEPGSGKSVALRHVAQVMAQRAAKARSAKSTVPIYINLKELKPGKGEAIDRNLIQAFVLKSLNRANDRDIEEFLENEFDRGLEEGTWLFLFDSFDEIPDILSSTEADAIIQTYSDAIADFLGGLNACRGILASRHFRGPERSSGQSAWPRFRILQLSESRKAELVRRADLSPALQTTIVGQLGIAGEEIRGMASNPMFLGLLCEYMRAGNPFPQNVHSVFETYVETRLTRDEARLQRRYKLKPAQIRTTAENVAFCMAADQGLGLTPTREHLAAAMHKLGFRLPKAFASHLDALEFIKLARSETTTAAGDSKPFTFAHRRFQEYFATSIVLTEQKRIAPKLLLTDARWRETAVVICQTQPAELLSPLLKEARKIITGMKKALPEVMHPPLEEAPESPAVSDQERLSSPFAWPPGLLHLASLLQDGFGNRLKDLPDDIRLELGRILWTSSKTGTLFDRKWALEVAGPVPFTTLTGLLRDAFASSSQWLSDVAFRQTARLDKIPEDIARSIRRSLVGLFATGRLGRERHATYAHLTRLPGSADFLATLRMLLWVRPIDLGLLLILCLFMIQLNFRPIPGETVPDPANLIWLLPLIALFLFVSYQSLGPLAEFYRGLSTLGWQKWMKNTSSKSGKAVAAAEIRFVFLPMAVAFALPLSFWIAAPSVNWILFFLFLIISLWAPIALRAAIAGQFTRPFWWPIMPLWPLLYLIQNFRPNWRSVWKGLKGVGVGLVVWGFLFWLIIKAVDVPIVQSSGSFMMILWVIFVFGGLGMLVFLWVSDWVRWTQWKRMKLTSMTAQEFLHWLVKFHNQTYRNELIKSVREQGLLVSGPETEGLISRLALELEHTLAAQNKPVDTSQKTPRVLLAENLSSLRNSLKAFVPRKNTGSALSEQELNKLPPKEFFEAWLASYQNGNPKKLASWGSEFLDEVWRLSEQVGGRRVISGSMQPAAA